MKQKIFRKGSLRNKFLLLFILLLLIPAVAIGSCSMSVAAMKKSLEQSSLVVLQSVDDIVYEKIKNIQRFVDVVSSGSEMQAVLSSEGAEQERFEEIMTKNIEDIDGIKGVVFITESAKVFTYNLNTMNIDYIKLQILYNVADNSPRALNWFADKERNAEIGLSDDAVVMGTTCGYGVDNSVNKRTARVYLCIEQDVFGDVLNTAPNDGELIILDKNGSLLNENRKSTWTKSVAGSIRLMAKLYETDSGIVTIEQKPKLVLSHYTSELSGFKYVKIYDYDAFYGDVHQILYTTIFITLTAMLVVGLIYFLLVKKITDPLREVAAEMNKFDDATLSKELVAKSNDEVGGIVRGFNKMRSRVCTMLEEVKKEEREKKNIELDMLRYQINPHFLYNTLGAIRIIAIKQHNDDVADSLLLLNKILKSVFSNANKYLTYKEEAEQLKDYVNLLQLRFNNQINFSANVPENMANVMVPAMLLQPIVENSIFHGLGEKLGDADFEARILVNAEIKGDDLQIEVFDNGVGMTEEAIAAALTGMPEKSRGIGLRNVDERIKLLYGSEYGLSIRSELNVYTSVCIKIKKS